MTTKQLQNRAKECFNTSELILKKRGVSMKYRARLELDKARIVIEEYYGNDWHFICDFKFYANGQMEYWSCGSSSWHYDFSMAKFEELMYNVGIYRVV